MIKPQLIKFWNEFRKGIRHEDSKFLVQTGIKVSVISLFVSTVVYSAMFQVMRLNYAFFKASGIPDLLDYEVFFDYLMTEALDNLPIIFGFHILLFFVGAYVGWLILRPFRRMGEYCDKVIENPNTEYLVDEFSTYKLFTRFSEFFFQHIRESRKKGELQSSSIPPQFLKIHQPVSDQIFMLHFGLLLVIVAISSTVFIVENSSHMFTSMVELATKLLTGSKVSSRYLVQQMFVMDDLIRLTIGLVTVSYLALGFHLYSKVSGAAFGIFSTMRSFMKGNYSSRVHLIGYAHIREYTRKLNKYLDYIENNLVKQSPKG